MDFKQATPHRWQVAKTKAGLIVVDTQDGPRLELLGLLRRAQYSRSGVYYTATRCDKTTHDLAEMPTVMGALQKLERRFFHSKQLFLISRKQALTIKTISTADRWRLLEPLIQDAFAKKRSNNRSKMDFKKYQTGAARTIQAQDKPHELINHILGLSGETGEVVEHVKKHLYHGRDLDLDMVAEELGDVLWYVAALCTTLGLSLDGVAFENLSKLRERYPDGYAEKGGE